MVHLEVSAITSLDLGTRRKLSEHILRSTSALQQRSTTDPMSISPDEASLTCQLTV